MGDALVVVLPFFFVRSFVHVGPIKLSVAVLVFAYLVEFGQYLELIDILGLSNSSIARVIIGTTFDYRDLLAYTLGAGINLLIHTLHDRILGFRPPTLDDDSTRQEIIRGMSRGR